MRTVILAASLISLGAAFGDQPETPAEGSVEGQVVNEASGAPLKNAIVKLHFLQQPGSEALTQETNEKGEFRFANLWGVGEWELSAERRGFTVGYYGASKYAIRGTHIRLQRNEHLKDLVLKLVPEAIIAGRVLDADGEPIEGVHVAILKLERSRGVPRWTEVASANTLDNGVYRCPRLAAGRYLVKCDLPRRERAPSSSGTETGYVSTWYPKVLHELEATPVIVNAGSEISNIDVHMMMSPLFSVRARFQDSGPATGAEVFLVEKGDETKVFSGPSMRLPEHVYGFYRIPPGWYFVHATWYEKGRTTVANQPVEVSDRDVDVVLNASPAGVIRGTLNLDPAAREIDLRTVSVTFEPEMVTTSCGSSQRSIPKIGADLSFSYDVRWAATCFVRFTVQVSNLPEGCYLASIRYGGKDLRDSGTEYVNDAALEIIIAPDGGYVDGTSRKENQPAGAAVIALVPSGGKGEIRSVVSGPDGAFHLAAVPPGDYKLLAWEDVARDDMEDPEFLQRFDDQATPIKVAPGARSAASIQVVQ